MPISALLDPTQMPVIGQDQKTFDTLWAGVLRALPAWGAQANALAASLNAIAFGGAYSVPLVFSTNAANAGKGGYLVWPSGGSSVTIDNADARGAGTAALLTSLTSSGSQIKAYMRFTAQGDPTRWTVLAVSIYATGSSSGSLAITFVSSAGSINEGESVIVSVQRTGDKGDVGAAVQIFHAREEQSSGTAAAQPSGSGSPYPRLGINTVKQNDFGAVLSGGRVTLPVGKYLIRARATLALTMPAQSSDRHTTSIVNFTDSSLLALGQSAYGSNPGTSSATVPMNTSEVVCYFSVASGTKTLDVRSYTNGTVANGGQPASLGLPEPYTEIIIEKIG